jgi:hypothetical protein
VSATVFDLIAIVLVIAFPLAVPVAVTVGHAVVNWRQKRNGGGRGR